MNDSCRKVSRGQVWFLTDNDAPVTFFNDHIQGKNRPWLVVSNNTCNQVSPVYTVVPLTSSPKNNQPTHVKFQTGDKEQTILCEQIRTIDQKVFFNSGSYYKWTMSEKYMAMVDEALAVQLGISLVFPNSERFWESLEKIIRVRVKQAVVESKVDALDISKLSSLLDAKVEAMVNEETVENVGAKLAKGFLDGVNEPPKPEIVEATSKLAEEMIATISKTPENLPLEQPKTFIPISKSKRRKWTYDEKREFLDYYAINGAQKTAKEYGLQIGSVHTTRFKFFKELEGEAKNNG